MTARQPAPPPWGRGHPGPNIGGRPQGALTCYLLTAMITDAYAQALYGALYSLVGAACQDRIRYAYGSWLARELPTDSFLGVLQAVQPAL